jgi:hypothetical protein
MEIPPKIRIPLCIQQGSVFNFFINFSDSKRESKNRYFIVLNRNPKTDVVLILITPTSQIDKRRKFIKRAGFNAKTLVEIKSKEYCVFEKDCAFDCNSFQPIKMSNLISKIEENGCMNYPKLPDDILARLIDGVKTSSRVPQEFKDLL